MVINQGIHHHIVLYYPSRSLKARNIGLSGQIWVHNQMLIRECFVFGERGFGIELQRMESGFVWFNLYDLSKTEVIELASLIEFEGIKHLLADIMSVSHVGWLFE